LVLKGYIQWLVIGQDLALTHCFSMSAVALGLLGLHLLTVLEWYMLHALLTLACKNLLAYDLCTTAKGLEKHLDHSADCTYKKL
jgi:hypothetical protein